MIRSEDRYYSGFRSFKELDSVADVNDHLAHDADWEVVKIVEKQTVEILTNNTPSQSTRIIYILGYRSAPIPKPQPKDQGVRGADKQCNRCGANIYFVKVGDKWNVRNPDGTAHTHN